MTQSITLSLIRIKLLKVNHNMRFYLFNINNPYPAYDTFEESSLGLAYMKSYLMKYADIDNLNIEILKYNVLDVLQKDQPEVIGISSVTQDYSNAIKFTYKIKERGIKGIIILGGIHISNLPESFNSIFDIGVVGEGEETIKELLEFIFQYGLDKSKLKEIKGLVFYDQSGNLVLTQRRELIKDLDKLPFPYRKEVGKKTFIHMLTSRGCPFKCVYCSSTSFWGKQIRFFSPAYVVEEMLDLILNHKVKHISIWDDLFTVNIKRLSEIVALINSKKKYFKNITFGVTTRGNVVDEDICKFMKEMNVTRVALGIESGSDRMLKKLNRGMTVEQVRKSIELLQKYNFNVHGGFIIGSPDETIEDLKATYEFMISSKLDSGGAGLAVPYPNTEFWHYAYQRGLVNENMNFSRLPLICDFSNLKEDSNFILLSEHISKKDIIDMGNKINQFFTHRNFVTLFNKKTLNLRNIFLVVSHLPTFLPFIFARFNKFIINFRRKDNTIKASKN